MQIPIPNKYLGFGYKGLVFAEILNMDKELTVPKMGTGSLAENTPNAP